MIASAAPAAVLAGFLAAAGPGPSAEHLDRMVVTASRRVQALRETAFPVSVLTEEELAAATAQTLAELGRGAVGAYLQQTTPGQGNIILRGLKGSEVLHLVDGVRLNNAFFRNAPNQYIALIDAQNVERLEILRGPAGALYGGDAMGGVIQVFTPEPVFSGTAMRSRGALRGFYLGADGSLLLRARHEIGREGFGISLGLTDQTVRERRIGGGIELPFTAFRAEAADFRLRLGEPRLGEWLLAYDRLIQPSTPRHDAMVPGFGQSQPENAEFFFEPNSRELARLRFRRAFGLPWLAQFTVQLARQQIVDDRRSRAFGSAIEEREHNESRLDSLSLTAESERRGGLALVYGAELLRDRIASERFRRDLLRGTAPVRASSRFPDGSRMASESLFAGADGSLDETTRLQGGLRLSRHRVELPPADRGVGVRLSFTEVTGDLGLLKRLSEGLELVARIAQGFRPPNVFDLGTLGPRPGNRFNLPNPELGPERILSADLGLRFGDGALSGELFLYRARYEDKIVSVLTGGRDAQGRLLVRNENLLRQDLRGIEAGFRYRLGESLALRGTLLHTRGDERTPERLDPADRIPPLSGQLAVTARFGAGELELFSRFARRQDRLSPRDRTDPRIDPRGTAGFAVFDLHWSQPLSDRASVRLRLDNVFDKRYREHGSGLDAPGRSLGLVLDIGYGEPRR